MADELFMYLQREGLVRRRGGVSAEAVRALTPTKILKTTRDLSRLSQPPRATSSATSLQHTAAPSLGGSPEYCREINCRTRSGQELVQFSLLYSDRVFVRSYFAGHAYSKKYVEQSADDARSDLLADLRVIYALRPAIEKGYIQFYTPPLIDCPQCLARETFGRNADKRLRVAQRDLSKRFLAEVDVDLLYFESEWSTSFTGPEDLLGHSGSIYSSEPADALLQFPRLLRRVADGEMVRLTKSQQQKLGIHHFLASEVIRYVAFEMLANQQLGTSLLTSRKSEVDVLNKVSADPSVEERNRIALEYMTSLVPFVLDVPASKLLMLREREGEAFARYRAALNDAIVSYRKETDFSVNRAKQLYGDVIAPNLAMLDQKVRGARRTLARELRADVTAWVGAISFGIYTGLIPSSVVFLK